MTRLWGTAAALALFSAAVWFAWLGWDHRYYLVDGVPQGPYRPWQVVGCVVSLPVGALVAYVRVRRWAAVLLFPVAATIGFAVPWTWNASSDETGLFLFGSFLIVLGGLIGIGSLLGFTHLVTVVLRLQGTAGSDLLLPFRRRVVPGGPPARRP